MTKNEINVVFTKQELYNDAIRYIELAKFYTQSYLSTTNKVGYNKIYSDLTEMVCSAEFDTTFTTPDCIAAIDDVLCYTKDISNATPIMESLLRARAYMRILVDDEKED